MSHFQRQARYDRLQGGDHFLVRITEQGDVRLVSVTDVTEYLRDGGLDGQTFSTYITPPVTVAQLPLNPVIGQRAFISDGQGNVFYDAVIGGGAYALPVFFDGNVWKNG